MTVCIIVAEFLKFETLDTTSCYFISR